MESLKRGVVFIVGIVAVIACIVYVKGLPGVVLGTAVLFFVSDYVGLWLMKISVFLGGIVGAVVCNSIFVHEVGAALGLISFLFAVIWIVKH